MEQWLVVVILYRLSSDQGSRRCREQKIIEYYIYLLIERARERDDTYHTIPSEGAVGGWRERAVLER
jgi:hypothetical protein